MTILTIEQLLNTPLNSVKHAKITNAQLTCFPEELFHHKESIEIIDLSFNNLTELPSRITEFKNLKILFLSFNQFKVFPIQLANCEQLSMIAFKSNQLLEIEENSFPLSLRWLILTDNQIDKIPVSIGNCKLLQKFVFAGNLIKQLPDSLSNCKNLELIRASANKFTKFPEIFLKLPKLAWLAFEGNPFSTLQSIPSNNQLPFVDWNDIELIDHIGEGASGIITKGKFKNSQKEIAIKTFKGDLTSDGYPKDELEISLLAGQHPNLVPLIAKSKNIEENKDALIMSFIPNEYKNLGYPPSLNSCTRDVIKINEKWTSNNLTKLLQGIASSMQHLHRKNISHGDLYTHNILYHPVNFHSYLGDFGAASYYEHFQFSDEIERIDVRAFGYLIDDLIELIEFPTENLLKIKFACLNETIMNRPSFSEIVTMLQNETI
jgi:Leucine-rich repeat (LRR) protein